MSPRKRTSNEGRVIGSDSDAGFHAPMLDIDTPIEFILQQRADMAAQGVPQEIIDSAFPLPKV